MISVMKKMRENRISCIPIERQISPSDEFTTRTVGIAYLSDLMFLLRIPNYYRYLEEPIINFIIDLNGLEEDGNYFDQFSQQSTINETDLGLGLRNEEKKVETSEKFRKQSSVKYSRPIDEELDSDSDAGEDEEMLFKEQVFEMSTVAASLNRSETKAGISETHTSRARSPSHLTDNDGRSNSQLLKSD